MAKKNVYLATVKILVEADNENEACDAISQCLTHNLMDNGEIIDWQYTYSADRLKNIGQFELPSLEGEIFGELNK